MEPKKNFWSIILISLTAIICIFMLSGAYKYKYQQQESITVTGAAEMNFVSDLIVWNASFSRSASNLQDAYTLLQSDEQKVRQYLREMKINEEEVVFSSVQTDKLYTTQYDHNGHMTGTRFDGYQLTQTIKITSQNIPLVDKVSREITSLIRQGVEMNSSPPSYYYTKLGELKIDLLKQASADGKERAETIAKNAGIRLGQLKKATMGIFQIIGQNENEDYSYGGTFNTTSLHKTATITVKMEFSL